MKRWGLVLFSPVSMNQYYADKKNNRNKRAAFLESSQGQTGESAIGNAVGTH